MAMSNFNQRLLTSAGLVVLYLVLFLLRAYVGDFGVYAFDAVIFLAACFSTWELCNAKNLNQRGANAYVAIIVYALVYMFYIIGTQVLANSIPWWLQIVVSLIIIGMFVLFIGLSNMLDKKMAKECSQQKKDFNHEAWGGAWDLLQMIVYPGCFFACWILLNHLSNLGLFGMLLTVFISCFTDTFAYSVGMVLGKNTAKMSPAISPKKTWVGFIGSLFGGVLGALIVVWIISADAGVSTYLVDKIGEPMWVMLLFMLVGLIGAMITTMGDLYASWIKRKSGIKDFGHILPGQGGILDRFDGIIVNVPFILLIMGII